MSDLYLTEPAKAGLLWYYVLLAAMNFAFAALVFRRPPPDVKAVSAIWGEKRTAAFWVVEVFTWLVGLYVMHRVLGWVFTWVGGRCVMECVLGLHVSVPDILLLPYLLAILVDLVCFALVYFAVQGLCWCLDRVIQARSAALVLWLVVGALALMHALAYFLHGNLVLPKWIRERTDFVMDPVVYTSVSVVAFVRVLVYRRFYVRPQVAWAALNVILFAAGWAMTDPNFQAIVTKPDNVPISLLIFSVGFFTWLALYRAVRNDERLDNGEPALEKLDDEKVLVWPDLVYTELICMVIATVVLIAWAILLKAPLEPPATTAKAPNPSKAPWYFLGLQEMLVYFDPWMAGVVLPTFIIIGLIALPYIDFNREGNGFYTFERRGFAVTTFMFGFIVLWTTLIVLGTFLRGPNWNFFGPFSNWDPHKVLPLNNVNVSELFWLRLLHKPLEGMNPVVRELPGLVLLFVYLFLIPPILARTVLRKFFIKMGFARYMILVVLLLFMAALPIKMVLRWTLNLKYVVYFPEVFFNI